MLKIDNLAPSAGTAKIENWYAEINGQKVKSGLSLASPAELPLTAMEFASFPLQLAMDMAMLTAEGVGPFEEYQVNLIIELVSSFDSAPPENFRVSCFASFPGIQAPGFSITAIAIIKDVLINTKFKVTMKVDNPNPFPMDLSSFRFELYGNGLPWADGTEKNLLNVPPKSSVETTLFLIMNFINMKRDLLDQIIRLQDVNYRFSGDAQVSTGIDYLPGFNTGFDLSGYSKVTENDK